LQRRDELQGGVVGGLQLLVALVVVLMMWAGRRIATAFQQRGQRAVVGTDEVDGGATLAGGAFGDRQLEQRSLHRATTATARRRGITPSDIRAAGTAVAVGSDFQAENGASERHLRRLWNATRTAQQEI
jgi:hypothetical protein